VNTPVKTVAVLMAKDGREDELNALLQGMVLPSRAEDGNLRYDLWRDADQPSRFVIDEVYRDADAITSHRSTKHFQAYLARINDLADRNVLVLKAENVA
jgi:quinol monooxygenase YgiN